jgi:hypothetical protein
MERKDFLTLELLIQAINKIGPNWRVRLNTAKAPGAAA